MNSTLQPETDIDLETAFNWEEVQFGLPWGELVMGATRYGVYEGGRFYACIDGLPEEAFSGDVPCSWWWNHNGHLVGTGHTPNSALLDLAEKVKNYPKDWIPEYTELPDTVRHWQFYNTDGTTRTWDECPQYLQISIFVAVSDYLNPSIWEDD